MVKKVKKKICPWCGGERKWLKWAEVWKCIECDKEIKEYKFK